MGKKLNCKYENTYETVYPKSNCPILDMKALKSNPVYFSKIENYKLFNGDRDVSIQITKKIIKSWKATDLTFHQLLSYIMDNVNSSPENKNKYLLEKISFNESLGIFDVKFSE